MKSLLASLVFVIGSTAYAGEKAAALSPEISDFEFLGQEKALDMSYGFAEDIHKMDLIVEPEPDDSVAVEPFKEIEGPEIDENFSVASKRKPASTQK